MINSNKLQILFSKLPFPYYIHHLDMKEALKEVERVVKPEGYAIHLLLRLDVRPEKEILTSIHQTLTSSTWNYQFEEVDLSDFKETGVMSPNAFKIKYWKQLASEK